MQICIPITIGNVHQYFLRKYMDNSVSVRCGFVNLCVRNATITIAITTMRIIAIAILNFFMYILCPPEPFPCFQSRTIPFNAPVLNPVGVRHIFLFDLFFLLIFLLHREAEGADLFTYSIKSQRLMIFFFLRLAIRTD